MMLGKKIDMTVPAVNIVKMDDLINSAGEKEVIGILVKVLGDIKGSIEGQVEFEKDKAMQIANKLIGNNDMTELNSMSTSALCEIGNIVSASYMNSIAKFTGLEISPSVPELADDMSSSILSIVFVESGQYDDYILDIETIFLDENNNNLGAHFYYVPEPGSLEKILKTIGIN